MQGIYSQQVLCTWKAVEAPLCPRKLLAITRFPVQKDWVRQAAPGLLSRILGSSSRENCSPGWKTSPEGDLPGWWTTEQELCERPGPAATSALLTPPGVAAWRMLLLHARSADSSVSRSSSRLEMLSSMHVKSLTSSKLCIACEKHPTLCCSPNITLLVFYGVPPDHY